MYDLRPQDHPFVDKDLRFYQFESFDCGIVHLVQNVMDTLEVLLLALRLQLVGDVVFLVSRASYRIGVREVVLSLYSSQEWKGGPSCT